MLAKIGTIGQFMQDQVLSITCLTLDEDIPLMSTSDRMDVYVCGQ